MIELSSGKYTSVSIPIRTDLASSSRHSLRIISWKKAVNLLTRKGVWCLFATFEKELSGDAVHPFDLYNPVFVGHWKLHNYHCNLILEHFYLSKRNLGHVLSVPVPPRWPLMSSCVSDLPIPILSYKIHFICILELYKLWPFWLFYVA